MMLAREVKIFQITSLLLLPFFLMLCFLSHLGLLLPVEVLQSSAQSYSLVAVSRKRFPTQPWETNTLRCTLLCSFEVELGSELCKRAF